MIALLALLSIGSAAPARVAWLVEREGVCRWEAVAVGGDKPVVQTLATFPSGCFWGQVWFTADGTRALVQVRSALPGGEETRIYEVHIGRGLAAELSPIPLPYSDLYGLGFGADGQPRLYGVVEVEEKAFALEYAWRGQGWAATDRVPTETGFCGAAGLSVLAGHKEMLAATRNERARVLPVAATPAEADALSAASGKITAEGGFWQLTRAEGATLAQWTMTGDEGGGQPSEPLAIRVDGTWRILPSHLHKDYNTLQTHVLGHYLLASQDGQWPAVIDLLDGQVVWEGQEGFAALWWP